MEECCRLGGGGGSRTVAFMTINIYINTRGQTGVRLSQRAGLDLIRALLVHGQPLIPPLPGELGTFEDDLVGRPRVMGI
jgi:hypothetical protein